MKTKYVKIVMLACLLALLSAMPVMAQDTPVSLVIDGEAVVTDQAPYIKNDCTMVPVRVIAENLGAAVEWDAEAYAVTITRGETVIRLSIGSAAADVDGTEITLEAAPEIVPETSRTMVPFRFVSEALGAAVEWDDQTYTVTVTTPAAEPEPEPAAEPKPKPGTHLGVGKDSALHTIRMRDFEDGDVLRYSMKGGEVDTHEVLYDYSENTAKYSPLWATLDKISGSVLIINPTSNSTPTTLRLDEDTIFFDASSDTAGEHERLTKTEFNTFKGDPIIIWTAKDLTGRGSDDLARLVIRVRR